MPSLKTNRRELKRWKWSGLGGYGNGFVDFQRARLEQKIGGGDESASKKQAQGEGFVGVGDARPSGEPGWQKERQQGGKDRFGAVDQAGFGGGDMALPAVHDQITSQSADDDECGHECAGRR